MAKRAPRPGVGHPSEYTVERGEAICQLIETSDKGLHRLHEDHPEVMPGSSTMTDWLTAHPEFASRYARARELQSDFIVDAGQKILDDAKPTGGGGIASARIAKAREQAQHRRWVASRLAPKKWGDRVEHDLGPKAASTFADLMRRAADDSSSGGDPT